MPHFVLLPNQYLDLANAKLHHIHFPMVIEKVFELDENNTYAK